MRLLRVMVRRLRVCFNPRICKRCDCTHHSLLPSLSVSIHASVKDATPPATGVAGAFGVSIHASVKDATAGGNDKIKTNGSFNPRICKRCDSEVYSACALVNCYNPRICKRCDINGFVSTERISRFNPRICKRCD